MSEIWEHEYVIFDVKKGPKVMKETLNTYGKEGWQLTSVINVGGEKLCAWLKRCETVESPNKKDQEKEELMSLWSEKNGE